MTQKGIGALMTDMSEREKKTLFAGSVPIGLNRNQVRNLFYIDISVHLVCVCVWRDCILCLFWLRALLVLSSLFREQEEQLVFM